MMHHRHDDVRPTLDVDTAITARVLSIDIRGEADNTTHGYLRAALSAVDLDGVDAVQVRLTDLTFCDAGAFRVLHVFALEVTHAGRHLSMHGAGRLLRKTARILGLEHQLGLT